MEFQHLFIVDLQQRAVIDPDSTVSRRTLALEHAQHRVSFFLEELPGACIREAPQLPIVWQISRALGDPGCKQKVEKPGLLVVFERAVTHLADEAMHVERKPLEKLGTLRDSVHRRFPNCLDDSARGMTVRAS